MRKLVVRIRQGWNDSKHFEHARLGSLQIAKRQLTAAQPQPDRIIVRIDLQNLVVVGDRLLEVTIHVGDPADSLVHR